MKTIFSLSILLLSVSLLIAGGDKEKKSATKLELKISGMTCAGCAAHVDKTIRQDKGVADAQVDWKKGTAVVTFKEKIEGTACLPLFAELKKAGYTLEEIKDESGARWSMKVTCCGPSVCKISDK